MNERITRVALIGAGVAGLAWAAPPASAQTGQNGVPTETQQRLAEGQNNDFDWNWIGLFGLFGLAGLHKRPDYHDPI
jgi:hypothetical protein